MTNDDRPFQARGRAWAVRLLVFRVCLAVAAAGDDVSGVRVLPGLYHDVSFAFLANQQNDFDRDRYVSELALTLDYPLVTVGDRTTILWDLALRTGMGESGQSHLPFASYEVSYRLGPWWEYRRGAWLGRLGLDHTCSHLVYKDIDEPWYEDDAGSLRLPDVYYNRFFAGFGTARVRPPVDRACHAADLAAGRRHGPPVWYVEAGAYARSLLGIVDREALYEGNTWTWDLRGEGRYPLWVARHAVLSVTDEARVLGDRDGRTYWSDRVGLDLMFPDGKLGAAFFLKYNAVDEHPRDARERILEVGLRAFL